jgi:hypothetical protein
MPRLDLLLQLATVRGWRYLRRLRLQGFEEIITALGLCSLSRRWLGSGDQMGRLDLLLELARVRGWRYLRCLSLQRFE